jgi:uncharacterized protein
MDRQDLVLAALAAAGGNATFAPVQIQKFFFLIDREGAHLFGGPHFNFMRTTMGHSIVQFTRR